MKPIPSNEELSSWYEEALTFLGFIESLNSYQKSKLIDFTRRKIQKIFYHTQQQAREIYSHVTKRHNDNGYFPIGFNEVSLRHIQHELIEQSHKRDLFEAITVLNQFNIDWSLEKGYYKIEQNTSREIEIDMEVQEKIFNGLKPYFIEDQHSSLENLLKGNSIFGKIDFQEAQNQLADLFYQLHENNKISTTKESTKKWLVEFFTYKDSNGEQCPLTLSSLTSSFTPSKSDKRPNRDNSIVNKMDLF